MVYTISKRVQLKHIYVKFYACELNIDQGVSQQIISAATWHAYNIKLQLTVPVYGKSTLGSSSSWSGSRIDLFAPVTIKF